MICGPAVVRIKTLAKCKHLIDVWVRIASWLTRWALWKMEES